MNDVSRQVAETLQLTLQHEPSVRKPAEQQISQFEQQPGFAMILLQLLSSDAVGPEIRMAAAVAFKNFIKKNWGPTPEVDISPDEEQQVRDSVIEAMFANRGNLQNQLSHSLQLIAQRDFPSRWPTLVPSLAVHLTGDNLDPLVATLSALDQIFKKFRYQQKSTELWLELKDSLMAVQDPLSQLFYRMVGLIPQKDAMGADNTAQWLEVMYLTVRIFHSLCVQDLPAYFEDNLKPWVDGFLAALALDCPSQVSATGEPTYLEKLKTEICEVLSMYALRFDEEINPHMQQIIQAVWQLVVQTGQDVRFDGMVCASLDFLSHICQKAYYESYFVGDGRDGVLQTLAQDVCVRNLTLRQEDLELFEDEPIDYMKRDLEGTDAGTRRRGAIDLVRALCRRFEAQLVPILTQIVQGLMASENWMQLDVVYCLVTAMASKSETARMGATSTNPLVDVSDYYVNQVRANLANDVNETPILKADALKYAVTFRNMLRAELLVEVVQACDRLLTANLPILHKYAAYAIDKLLLVKQPGGQGTLLTATTVPVASLLTNLVSAFEKDPKAQNSPYLIKAVLRVVAILDDNTARHAASIATRLAALVDDAVKNPADSVHTHFLFETICVLINKTATLPNGGLDAQLMPLIETILTRDLVDLIPYALQITGVLLQAAVVRGTGVDQYASFVPCLLEPQLWARSANVPAALVVVEVYLKHCAPQMLGSHAQKLLAQYQRLMASKSLDQYGFQLANALLPVIEAIQGVDTPMKNILACMFQRIQGATKTPKFLKLFIVFLARFVIVRGAADLATCMTTMQANMYQMVMEKVVLPALADLKNMTTAGEKRIIAIGFANILADTTAQLIQLYGKLAMGVSELVESASASERGTLSPEEEQASMYNAEGEFTNPYCRLSYAPRADPVAPEIQNYRAYLAVAVLQRAPAAHPAVINVISADPDLQQKLAELAN